MTGDASIAGDRPITGGRLRDLVIDVCERLPAHAEELGDLDAALGDGDLGVTVRAGCEAVATELALLPDDVAPSAVLSAAGLAFASANPSTMAALVGQALRAASKAMTGRAELGPGDAAAILVEATEEIQRRGGAQIGDKTIVDAMAPTAADLTAQAAERPDGPIDVTRLARLAADAVTRTAALSSQRGRASWQGERTRGQIDPGARLFQRLVEEFDRH